MHVTDCEFNKDVVDANSRMSVQKSIRNNDVNRRKEPQWVHHSPVIADLYMEFFEESAITDAQRKPSLWLR